MFKFVFERSFYGKWPDCKIVYEIKKLQKEQFDILYTFTAYTCNVHVIIK